MFQSNGYLFRGQLQVTPNLPVNCNSAPPSHTVAQFDESRDRILKSPDGVVDAAPESAGCKLAFPLNFADNQLGPVYAKSCIISKTTARFRKPGHVASSLSNRV